MHRLTNHAFIWKVITQKIPVSKVITQNIPVSIAVW